MGKEKGGMQLRYYCMYGVLGMESVKCTSAGVTFKAIRDSTTGRGGREGPYTNRVLLSRMLYEPCETLVK